MIQVIELLRYFRNFNFKKKLINLTDICISTCCLHKRYNKKLNENRVSVKFEHTGKFICWG